MQNPIYPVARSEDGLIYEFYSDGPKGRIIKQALFLSTEDPDLWVFGFGDVQPDGNPDDEVESNNGDMPLVMSTVISILFDFFDLYPKRYVYLTGSTPQRTKFYQWLIERYRHQVIDKIWIEGGTEAIERETMVPNKKYSHFYIGLH